MSVELVQTIRLCCDTKGCSESIQTLFTDKNIARGDSEAWGWRYIDDQDVCPMCVESRGGAGMLSHDIQHMPLSSGVYIWLRCDDSGHGAYFVDVPKECPFCGEKLEEKEADDAN